MLQVSKEKNMLKMVAECGVYYINYNTLALLNEDYTLRKTCPRPLIAEIKSILDKNIFDNNTLYLAPIVYMAQCWNTSIAKLVDINNSGVLTQIQFIEKILNVDNTLLSKCDIKSLLRYDIKYITLISETFGDFIKYLKDCKANQTGFNIFNYIKKTQFDKFVKQHNIPQDVPYLLDFIKDYSEFFSELSEEEIKSAIYIIKYSGIMQFSQGYSTYPFYNRVSSWLRDYFDCCRFLEIAPEKTKNFMKTYADTLEMYNQNKDKKINENLAKYQNARKKELSFETEDYIVVVPTTKEEFLDEGSQQHNCVSRCYLEPVAKNELHIVFIREKADTTQSFVTCEIDLNGRIHQYLGKYNRSMINNPKAIEFKRLYQEHLSSCWN